MNRYYLKETQDDFRFVVSQLFCLNYRRQNPDDL